MASIVDETLTREQVGAEFLLMGLRLAEGVDPTPLRASSPDDRSMPFAWPLLRDEGAL